jgi:hypothetical protein
MIDSYGQKWIQMRYNVNTNPYSIIVFSDNGTPDNTSDDMSALVNSSIGQGNLPGHTVSSMVEDKDGYIWVGTDQGIGVFKHPENIFAGSNFDCEHLTGYENVTAIEVDAENKKWIGTNQDGIYQLSADGTTVINHFTFENSPLFSNNITCIAINQNGEVFIGTNKGIISVKKVVNGIDPSFYSEEDLDVKISPNPWSIKTTIEFTNPNNLNYTLSVFSISGNKVFEMDNITSDKIELERGNLPKGVYIIEFKGAKVFRGKIVVK